MEVIFVLGRIALASLFLLAAPNHFKPETIEYARSTGAPRPDLLVPATGIAMGVGGLMVALGLAADLGALILIATMVPVTFIMHAFWNEGDPQAQQMQFAQFFKNIQAIGGLLIVFYIYSEFADAPASLTDGVF